MEVEINSFFFRPFEFWPGKYYPLREIPTLLSAVIANVSWKQIIRFRFFYTFISVLALSCPFISLSDKLLSLATARVSTGRIGNRAGSAL